MLNGGLRSQIDGIWNSSPPSLEYGAGYWLRRCPGDLVLEPTSSLRATLGPASGGRGATMTNASYERRASATGRCVHWARPGDRYALCGSVVVDAAVVADDRPVVALLTS